MKYMLVVHYKFTDTIKNEYFDSEESMKTRAKYLKQKGNEILHMFKIKEVEDSKFIVEYKFINTLKIISKEFDDPLQAKKYQENILKKYKNKMDYCMSIEVVEK